MMGNVATAGSAEVADPRFARWAIVANNLTKCFPGVERSTTAVSIYAGEIAAALSRMVRENRR